MALPSGRRNFPRVITASAAKFGSETSYSQRQQKPWQQRALEYYDQIGEVRYASQFYARMLSRIRIFPAHLTPDGELEPITSGPPLEIINRIQDPGGGRSQIQAAYGRLMFVTGEGVLFGARIGEDDERWNFLWLDEIQEDRGVAWRVDQHKQKIESGIAYRMWRPHPRHSDLADAPLCSVQEVCEELILLTKAVQSTALTRLTNGLLLMPQEISPGAAEPIGDEDAENNPFIADLIEHFIGQIENPGSAEARVPPLVEASYEYLDRVRWMQMHDPATDYLERDLRTEAIKRLALGLDFPPEVLLGMTDANHWTARQVVHDMWRSHGAPVAEQFCDDLSEAYLRPALKDAGYAEWMSVVVTFDDADVVIAPDRSEDADKAADRGYISDDGYMEMKGIAEALRPSEDEKQLWIALKMRNPALLPEKYLPEGGLPQPTPATQPGPQPGPEDATDPQDGPPSPGTRDGSRPEARTASARIMGAADLSLVRCRELAGSRLRSYQKACPDCLAPADGQPNTLVAALIGPQAVETMKAPEPLKLVAGGSDGFRILLVGWGFPGVQAAALGEMIEVYAARTLYEKGVPQLPSGFAAHVDRVQDIVQSMEH